jgi:VanZ family protein
MTVPEVNASQRTKLGWTMLTVWGGTILVLSLIPSPPHICNRFLSWDKFQHASAYAVFTLFGYLAFTRLTDHKRRIIAAMVVAVVFGAMIEVAQGLFTATRQADYRDVVANAFGALMAWTAVTLYNRLKRG